MNQKLSMSVLAMCLVLSQSGCSESEIDSSLDLSEREVKTLTLIADGPFTVPGADAPPPVVDEFYAERFGLDEADLKARNEEAVAHFSSYFGADVSDEENAARLALVPFIVNPSVDYRVTAVNGEEVESAYTVHDAGWILVVLDPEGFELGGNFPGIVAGPGPVATVGDYGIEQDGKVIRIKYEATRPMNVTADGVMDFECALTSEDFGEGLGRGTQGMSADASGAPLMAIDNTLEFDE